MSIDNTRECIRSKYFTSKTVMEESLTDFKETKPNCKGPKTVKKPVKPKTGNVKKPIKRQKDIRTALKSKKNDLESYSKEFDNICKKSGIDVDSEQLQIAIALSKSLQNDVIDNASTSQSLTSQGRISKIRTTLQEYGFTIPHTKITATKRVKKQRKKYKLLNITEEDRLKLIQKRYSEILLESLDSYTSVTNVRNNTPIFNVATGCEYSLMKTNNIFYVDNLSTLIEKSINIGTLLRNWSEIPGRPLSPVLFDRTVMDISEILCSQDELDVILSGPIKLTQEIVSKHVECITDNRHDEDHKGDLNRDPLHIDHILNSPSKSPNILIIEHHATETISVDITPCSPQIKEPYRSYSPDIFDDEVSTINEISNQIIFPGEKTKVFTEENNCMEITDCVLVNNVNSEQTLLISDTTKRKSNDFMEMTECAVTASQGIKENIKEIDLTQSPDENRPTINDVGVANDEIDQKDVIKTDSFERKNSCTSLENVNYIKRFYEECNINHITVTESGNDKEDCEINDNTVSEEIRELTKVDIDLTQSCYAENSLEKVNYIKQFYEECNINHIVMAKSGDNQESYKINDNTDSKKIHKTPKVNIDLTQSYHEDNNLKKVNYIKQFYEECNKNQITVTKSRNYKESNNINDNKVSKIHETSKVNIDLNQSYEENTLIQINNEITNDECENIDLTQSSKSSIDICDLPEINVDNTQSNQSDPDETIILNIDKYVSQVQHSVVVPDNEVFDLTQDIEKLEDLDTKEGASNQCSQSFYEDFVHNHSDSKENIDNHESPNPNATKESNDIDLTQTSNESIARSVSPKEKSIAVPNNSSLGKKDDISIDYDDISEHVVDSNKEITNNSIKSTSFDMNNDLISNCSQNSEVFDLTDKELDYSLHKSRLDDSGTNFNYDFVEISDIEPQRHDSMNTTEDILPEVNIISRDLPNVNKNSKNTDVFPIVTPKKNYVFPIVTPKNTEYIVKTDNVTPMSDYASMSTPQRNRELDKYGLKPFKRKKAIQLLTHVYNQTHPILEPYSDDDLQPSCSKKPRHDINESLEIPTKNDKSPANIPKVHTNFSPKKSCNINSISPRKVSKKDKNNSPNEGKSDKEDVWTYEITTELPSIKIVECCPDDWVFQKREKAKMHSCRVPLHIAFHNYVSSRQGLREAILRYEPVNIDIIHKDLLSYGHRYDPKDLLRFLDKKCITVKTADNNARNRR